MLTQPHIRSVVKGQNRYCGPAAISIIAGIDTTRAAKLLRLVSNKTMICGVYDHHMKKALEKLGYEMDQIVVGSENKTLFQWLKSERRNQVALHLVTSGHHYSIVQGDQYCCCQTSGVVPISKAAHPRSRMGSVFIVTKVREVNPETVIPIPPKDNSWLKRIVVTKRAKQFGIEIDDQTRQGGSIWVYGPDGLFTDENEEQDPFYDQHYHDTWEEVEKAVETYIALKNSPPVVALLEAACPNSQKLSS